MAIRRTMKTFCYMIGLVMACGLLITRWQISLTDDSEISYSTRVVVQTEAMSSSVFNASSIVPNEFSLSLAERYRIRKERTRAMCDRLRVGTQPGRSATEDSISAVAKNPSQFLVVDEKHKLIYCNVPKVSCTSWKRVFLTLAGFDVDHNRTIHHMGISRSGRTLLNYVHKYGNVSHRKYVLRNYRKFMVVRDPFTRLLSAYQNKLSPASRNGTTEMSDSYTKMALQILAQLRGANEANRIRKNMTLYDMTFAEFIHWLVRYNSPRDNATYDRHWERMHKLCHPCDLDYEIIGKYETIAEDASYILNTSGVQIPFPTAGKSLSTHSSVHSTVSEHYRTVSPHDIRSLYYDLFYYDFMLFGYSPRTFTEGVFPDDPVQR